MFGRMSWRSAIKPGLFRLSGRSPIHMFDALVPKDWGSRLIARDLAYADHRRGKLDLYAPRRAEGPLPVIAFFYGGSWNSGEKEAYSFVGRALAARGFLVAIPDYRLVPEVRFPVFLEDCAAAVRWVVANAAAHGGDAGRVVLAGHSAGAYNAAMLALDPQWLGDAKAAVRGLVGIAGPYDFLPLDTAVTRAAFGQAPDLAMTQPTHFGGPGAVPALLLAGAEDTTVRPVQTKRLAQRIRAETRFYPGIGHVAILAAVAMPLRGRAPVLADVARFAKAVTGAG